jgi:hemolysin activation/secretion protein
MAAGAHSPCRCNGKPIPVALITLAVLAGYPTAWAQPAVPAAATPAAKPAAPAMAVPAASPVFAIRGFEVTGDNPLGPEETQRVLAPYRRADATLQTLQEATAALEKALAAKGYGLHRVALPPQEVGATVRLNVVHFTLGKVTIQSKGIYDEGNIRRSLPELREGTSPNFKRLAVQTAIANENPNKQVQVGLRESEVPDQIDANVDVKESRPWTAAIALSNAGSESTGRDRITFSAGHTNLFNLDHQFVGAYTTSVQRTEDVKQLGLQYKIPLYSMGAVLGAMYTRSDVVGNFGTFSSTGAGDTFGVNATWYLHPEGGRRSYVTLSLDDKVFDATVIDGVPVGVDRRSRPVTLSYAARTEVQDQVWGYNFDLAANIGSGAHNDLASYQNEDPRISTIHWQALRGGMSYAASFAKNWLWSARAQFQYSPTALISGEQFGLGGLGSVRGTSEDRAITGDKGLLGSLEITTPELAPGLRLLGFIDAGWLGNNDPNGTSKPSSDHLTSLGLGLRYTNGPFSASMDYGQLLSTSKVPLSVNSAAPQRGDDRLYVSVIWRF